MTAREAAAELGVTPRTVRALVAEPRAEYLARAKARRDRVVALRREGLTRGEIAERTGATVGAVGGLLALAAQNGELPPDLGIDGRRGPRKAPRPRNNKRDHA